MNFAKHLVSAEEIRRDMFDHLACVVERVPEVRRTSKHVYKEYNKEKFGEMLSLGFNQYPNLDKEILVWWNGFQIVPLWRTIDFVLQKVRTTILDHFGTCKVCDLGAGSGYYTSRLGLPQDVYAGEWTENGRILCKRRGIRVFPFDFNDPKTYDFIEPDTVILTMQAIEQLRTAEHFIEGLARIKNKIVGVVNMEPQPLDVTISEQELFNSWIRKNDYNQDLFIQLDKADVFLRPIQHNMIGINPVNPVHLIAWSF